MAGRNRLSSPLLFAIATLFGVSSTFQSAVLYRLTPERLDPPLLILAALNLIYWYIPALLVPVIMTFASQARLRRARWPAQVAVHLAGAIGYAMVHTSVMLTAKAILLFGQSETRDAMIAAAVAVPTWGNYALRDFLMQLDWLLMTYLFLVGLAFARAFHHESEEAGVRSANLQTRLVEAQFQALQRQLHPHFLFNTLNTISGLIQTDPKAADVMIDRLGDLLRMTLHTSGIQEVTLKEELEVVQKYLEIEQTRFGDRLRVTFEVDPDTLDARVPNLLLQPLVENAIRHGIAPKARPGWLTVRAGRQDKDLTVDVRDSGDGLPPDRLMALNRGVGLANTRARLEHLYRARFAFVFENVPGGFSVNIRIPFNTAVPVSDAAERIA